MKLITATENANPLILDNGTIIYEMIGKNYAPIVELDDYSVGLIVVPKCDWNKPHYHKIVSETYHVTSGQLQVDVDGKVTTVSAGQAILLEPNEVHKFRNVKETVCEFLVINSPPATEDDHFYAGV